MSIECKCDVTALCSDMASDALKTTGVSKEQNASKANVHRVQADQREAAQSDEADCEEGSRKQPEGPKGAEPPHHARRPMNAFLIFCKRHRGVVRDRFPHLENRSVTKILGEWWANLEAQEKASYTELAKQYKEAFLQANPDFKWYKLPAPPLRTLVTRPSNQTRPLKLECDTACGGPITPGKLADETQMGSLSSLLASLPPPGPAPLTPPPVPPATGPPKPPKKRYLQELGAGEAQHALPLPLPPIYRLRMAASEEIDRNLESRSPFRQLPSAVAQTGSVLNEGTTLKTSKQDIIDRVVDRMCRLADGEGIGSKLSDNNNDAQYPCSKERSLVGDIESRCCTGAQSQKSLFLSSGSPGPPAEGGGALKVVRDAGGGNVLNAVPEDSAVREEELNTVREDSEDNADFPVGAVVAERKVADEIKDFPLSEINCASPSFSSSSELGTINSTVDCLNLRKTKVSLKEFQKGICEKDDSTTASSTLTGEFDGRSRESCVGEEGDTSLEKTEFETKTKVSKDLSSSSNSGTKSFSAPPQNKGAEYREGSTNNVERQGTVSPPERNSTNLEHSLEECSLFTDKLTGRDSVVQLSHMQDTLRSSAGTKNEDYSGPNSVAACLQNDDASVTQTETALECLPNTKSSWKRDCSSPKVKKLPNSESIDNIQSESYLLKCEDCPAVAIVSTEGQAADSTDSGGNNDCSKVSAADFSISKLKNCIGSDVCTGPDEEETLKVPGKKTDQKLLQVKPSVRTVESATQFDGGAHSQISVNETSKNECSKVKNVYSTALLKYRPEVEEAERKDCLKTEGLSPVVCTAKGTGIFSSERSAECEGGSDTNFNGKVKVKMANKVSSANILNRSPLKKTGKFKVASKKREHVRVSSGFEMVKTLSQKHFKRLKLDSKIAQDLQTKNVPVLASERKRFSDGGGILLPYFISERDFRHCDKRQATGNKTLDKCMDLKVYRTGQKGNCKPTVISASENIKSAASTICPADVSKENLGRGGKILCEASLHSESSELSTNEENNDAVQMCGSTMHRVKEAATTCNELAESKRTEENPDNTASVVKTDNVELVDICVTKDNIFNCADDKTRDQSTLNDGSKFVQTSAPLESYEGGSISVVEESAISELTASTSSVVLDIDLDLTQTRLSPQGLADLAAKDGVVVLTLPVDDELVLPPLVPEPQPTDGATQSAAVECLEAASQTQYAAGGPIAGGDVIPAIAKETSSTESEDSRESMSEETTAASSVVEDLPLEDAGDSAASSSTLEARQDPTAGSSLSEAAALILSLNVASECLPAMDVSADSSVSIQKSEECFEGDLNAVRRKSTRTCKGLRYHQFMVEGRLKKGHRRPVSRGSSEKGVKSLRSSSCAFAVHSTGLLIPSVPVPSPSDVTCALPSISVPTVGSSNARSGSRDVSSGSDRSDAEMDMPLEMRNRFSTPDNLQRIYPTKSKFEKPLKDALDGSMLDLPAKKRFRAADFNLEEKIEALPSLSLEEFQMKKKARKRKALPPPVPPDPRLPPKQTVPSPAVSPDSTEGSGVAGNRVTLTVEATAVVASTLRDSSDASRLCSTAQLQNAVGLGSASAAGGVADSSRQLVGSQKRKARKQSITRLDSDNVHILRDTAVVEPAVLSNIALSSLATIAVTGSKLVK